MEEKEKCLHYWDFFFFLFLNSARTCRVQVKKKIKRKKKVFKKSYRNKNLKQRSKNISKRSWSLPENKGRFQISVFCSYKVTLRLILLLYCSSVLQGKTLFHFVMFLYFFWARICIFYHVTFNTFTATLLIALLPGYTGLFGIGQEINTFTAALLWHYCLVGSILE